MSATPGPTAQRSTASRVGIIGDSTRPTSWTGTSTSVRRRSTHGDVDTIVHIGDMFDNHSLSFHDSEPMLHNVAGEYESAFDRAKDWYEAFPTATLIMGNHDRIPARQLRKLGMEPSIFMKPIEELFVCPRAGPWPIRSRSTTCSTTTVRLRAASTASVRTRRRGCGAPYQGHNHSNAGISATATDQELGLGGMAVGCGVNHEHMAFAYARTSPRSPSSHVALSSTASLTSST